MELLGPAWGYFWREESPYVISAALLLAALLWTPLQTSGRELGIIRWAAAVAAQRGSPS